MAVIPINMKTGTVVREREVIVGIDLGTTNSLVAYMENGVAKCVSTREDGNTLMPSVIHFTENQEVIVGEAAKQRLLSDPARTIYSVKRLMGKSYRDVASFSGMLGYQIIDDDTESLVKIRVDGKFFSPIELSAYILRALKNKVEAVLGLSVSKAVVTVPAYFNDNQRQATRDAGKLAGLDVLRIVNEPTAAALAYGIGIGQTPDGETIAVYDLGGGTFDVSILHIQDGVFEVLSTHGDTFLGGDDFDSAIMDFWMETANIPPDVVKKDKTAGQSLRELAERAKKHLSTEDVFSENWQGKWLEISRADFEQCIRPLVGRTIQSCKHALSDAQLSQNDIQKIVMVGGSTRIPMVKREVELFFGKPVFDQLNPDEVVALGAAIQADILAGNQRDLLLLDVTPLSLGIETVGGLMDVIIPRNSKVPGKAARQYTTSIDGQTKLKVAVYQGERDLVEHNRKLGEFILSGIPPMPSGLPKIDIQFVLNADGILTVRARELRSNVEQKIEIMPTYGITEEQMARMLLESIQHASEDVALRGLLEARNEANHLLSSGKKFLQQNEHQLSADEIDTITQLLTTLQSAAEGSDKDAIHRATQALNTYTAPIAHRVMDSLIGDALSGKSVMSG